MTSRRSLLPSVIVCLSHALSLSACKRQNADPAAQPAASFQSTASVISAAPALPPEPSVAPVASEKPKAREGLEINVPCSPLEQVRSERDCDKAPADERMPFPEGWNDTADTPPCMSAAKKQVVQVSFDTRVTKPRTSDCVPIDLLMRVSTIPPTELLLCGTCNGAYDYHVKIDQTNHQVFFSCSDDMFRLEGTITVASGALVRAIWDKMPDGPYHKDVVREGKATRIAVLDRATVALPCGASVMFKTRKPHFFSH